MALKCEKCGVHLEELEKQVEALAKFKKWVHDYLDLAGVPHDPYPEHTEETGCRISGRMRWLYSRCYLKKPQEVEVVNDNPNFVLPIDPT